jgi:ferredoxin-type protein NapF
MSPLRRFTRREFLTIAGSATALGVSYLILHPQPTVASVLLPGALAPAALFSAACSRCGKCVSACPHQAIRQNNQGLPYIDGLGGWCDFCMDCVKVCPTGALQTVDPQTAVIGIAEINRDQCIPWIRSGCRLCYEKCIDLRQAIQLDAKQRPSVDASRCNGCGACVFVCPQPSFEGQSKSLGKAMSLRAS